VDPYVILGVPRTATDDDIEHAYRRKAMATHPDRVAADDDAGRAAATEAFMVLNEAHRILTDADLRLRWHVRHDRHTHHAHPHGPPPPRRSARPRPRHVTDRAVVGGLPVHDVLVGSGRWVLHRSGTTLYRDGSQGLVLTVGPAGQVAPDGILGDRELFKVLAFDARLGPRHIDELAGNPTLRHLDLGGTNVTDDDVDRLCDLPHLDVLKLDATGVTDEVCRSVARLPDLEELSLMDTAITDAGLRLLADCPHLHTLDLRGTEVTAEGLGALANLTLHRVSLPFRITWLSGLRGFKRAHPKVLVT
jgi:hypothetical protein